MSGETAENRELMISTAGETYTRLVDPQGLYDEATIRLIPGHNQSKVADFHSPFDATTVDYVFSTPIAEADSVGLKVKQKIMSASGDVLKILSIVPDQTGWCFVQTAWEI